MEISVPAKIILSGEHAVVYGNPAIAMAVDRLAKCKIEKNNLGEDGILFELKNFQFLKNFAFTELLAVKTTIEKRYAEFLKGSIKIEHVLEKSVDLLIYALAYFTEQLKIQKEDLKGFNLKVSSDIPIGCGMGSSASVIVNLLQALTNFFSINLTLEQAFLLARSVENIQHGFSSGLDVYMAMHGGTVYFQNGKFNKIKNLTMPFYIINTGKPESSTGACVAEVASHFKNKALLKAFAKVTENLNKAIEKNDLKKIRASITANELLLEKIGVVPKRLQNFMRKLEAKDFAVKVCGAGAVLGEHAGIILALGGDKKKDAAVLQDLTKDFGYEILDVACS